MGMREQIIKALITKQGDTFRAAVDGRNVGSLNLATRGPYSTLTTVAPDMQRRGIATQLYQAAEDDLGRPLVPSPMGLSDSAAAFWKRRLSEVDPEQKQKLLGEAAKIGAEAGIPKSAADRMRSLGWAGDLPGIAGLAAVPPTLGAFTRQDSYEARP